MAAELDRYTVLGLTHSTHLAGGAPAPISPFVRDSHELTLCSNAIGLSIEGPAPLAGRRPVFLHDIMNPCWLWPKADLNGVTQITAGAAQLPFNFQIGAETETVAKRPAATPDGELEVHLDSCNGAKLATLAMPHPAPDAGLVTVRGSITPQTGQHDLCLMFTTPGLDPYWALHTIELVH
jgi:hexosaminidase